MRLWDTGKRALCGEAGHAFSTAAALLCELLKLRTDSSRHPRPMRGADTEVAMNPTDMCRSSACCRQHGPDDAEPPWCDDPCRSCNIAIPQMPDSDHAEAAQGGQIWTRVACEQALHGAQQSLGHEVLSCQQQARAPGAAGHASSSPSPAPQIHWPLTGPQGIQARPACLPCDVHHAPERHNDRHCGVMWSDPPIVQQQQQQQQQQSTSSLRYLSKGQDGASSTALRPVQFPGCTPVQPLSLEMLSKAIAMCMDEAHCFLQVAIFTKALGSISTRLSGTCPVPFTLHGSAISAPTSSVNLLEADRSQMARVVSAHSMLA